MEKNIILIGFMGAGKTAVGRAMAQKLGWGFVDTDQEIEKLTGLTVNEIFRRYGERRFRSEESLMAVKVCRRQRLVIATGGGMVLDPNNVKNLKSNGLLVWLKVSPEMVMKRVGRRTGERPLLRGRPTIDQVSELLGQREALYAAAADIVVENDNRSMDDLIKEILQKRRQLEIN